MSSNAPAARFSFSPEDPAIVLSELLAKASQNTLQGALLRLNDDLLGTLSAFADAIQYDRHLSQPDEMVA